MKSHFKQYSLNDNHALLPVFRNQKASDIKKAEKEGG